MRLLNIYDVASKLGISIGTVRNLRKQNSNFPPPLTVCRRSVRWNEDAIDTWIETQQNQKGKEDA